MAPHYDNEIPSSISNEGHLVHSVTSNTKLSIFYFLSPMQTKIQYLHVNIASRNQKEIELNIVLL